MLLPVMISWWTSAAAWFWTGRSAAAAHWWNWKRKYQWQTADLHTGCGCCGWSLLWQPWRGDDVRQDAGRVFSASSCRRAGWPPTLTADCSLATDAGRAPADRHHGTLPWSLDPDDVRSEPYDAGRLLKTYEARWTILLLVSAESQFRVEFRYFSKNTSWTIAWDRHA